MSWRPGRGRVERAAAAAAVAVSLVACSGTQFDYQRNTKVGAAFKLPSGWTTFDKGTLLGQQPGPQAATPDPIRWLVGFDGSPTPQASDVFSDQPDSTYPQGFALVQALTPEARDRISFGGLRNFPFPVDYFNDNDFRLVSYDGNVTLPGGYRGMKLTYQFRAPALAAARQAQNSSQTQNTAAQGSSRPALLDPSFVQVDEVALIDAKTQNTYYMVAWCSAHVSSGTLPRSRAPCNPGR
jgi:hypothetical protein